MTSCLECFWSIFFCSWLGLDFSAQIVAESFLTDLVNKLGLAVECMWPGLTRLVVLSVLLFFSEETGLSLNEILAAFARDAVTPVSYPGLSVA
jgi:hypothetical protein